MSNNLKKKIETLALDFVSAVMTAVRTASLEELSDYEAAPKAKPVRSTVPKPRAPKGNYAEIAQDIVGYVKSVGSARSEDIRSALNLSKADYLKAIPLTGLKKRGEKRATEYYFGSKPGPKKASKAKKPSIIEHVETTPDSPDFEALNGASTQIDVFPVAE